MLLAIDIGNSNLVVGVFSDDKWAFIWRIPTIVDESARILYQSRFNDYLLEEDIKFDMIQRIVISSVVPELTPILREICVTTFQQNPIVLGPSIYKQLPIKIVNPYQIGADLVANTMAAHQLYQKDAIIIDFGTALTFTTVNQNGATLGVAIAPGLKTATSALYQKTAQLPPEIPMNMPDSVLGMDTVHAIQSGVLIGYVGLVKHMIVSIREEVGQHFIAIATGGLSEVLTPLKALFDIHNPNLTLEGLRLIGEMDI